MASRGGAGGGVLRVVAGKIIDVCFRAEGEYGFESAMAEGGGGGGGGGSGGSLLIQTAAGISSARVPQPSLSTAGGLGGLGIGGTSFAGGRGGSGRLRVDNGVAQAPTGYAIPNGVGFVGAAIASDWPSAWINPPTQVMVVCGNSTSFTVEVDGVAQGSPSMCSSPDIVTMSIPISVAGAGIRRICTRVLPVASPPPLAYGAPYQEDRNCRSIAIAGN
jgi:hypothetical protein